MANETDRERVVITQRTVDLGERGKVRRAVYVEPTDGADVRVEWGNGDEESSVVSLEPDDLDALCHWWLTKGRPAYRAFVRRYHQEKGASPASDAWIARTPDDFDANKGE